MAYTSSANVTDLIGVDYNTSTDVTAAHVTAFIARADGLIDSFCARRFYPFNATGSSKTDGTDTYTTPKPVELASTHLAVGWALAQLRLKGVNTVSAEASDWHINQGNFYLNLLRDPSYDLPVNLWRNYTLSFGTSSESWDLGEDEAFISPDALDSGDPANIIEDSVRIGTGSTDALETARLGTEFKVRWDPGYQKYAFTALDSQLYAAGMTCKVTFNWTYERDRGLEAGLGGYFSSG